MTAVLEINDIGLLLSLDAEPIFESPGYAMLDDREIVVGADALAQSRLQPNRIQNRFWDQLSMEELPKPMGQARNYADLAYAHLKSLSSRLLAEGERKVIFSVPGTYDRQQLALLLGMAKECGLDVVGLVDTAVAASPHAVPGHNLYFLDIFLHRTILTELQQGVRLKRTRVDVLGNIGMSTLNDRWANRIADLFVSETRFDPMHVAQTEQVLYDHLGGWLRELDSVGAAELELPTGRKSYQVTAKRERVLEATNAHFRQIAEQINTRIGSNGPVALQISHRVAALPGLSKELEQQIDCQIIELEREAAARGAVRHGEHLVQGGKGVRFVTSVPWSLDSASPISTTTPRPDPTSTAQTAVPAAAASPLPPPSPPRPRRPSHAVVHGIAHPLNRHDTRLDALIGLPAGSDAATITLRVVEDGVLVDPGTAQLHHKRRQLDGVAVFGIGDRITLPDGEELLLIEVAGENAS
jgi:hypothetical protein